MRGDYRDGGRRDAGNPSGLANGPGASTAAFLDHLSGKTRNDAVVEGFGDRARRQRAQPSQAFLFAHDVALVLDAVLQDALFLARKETEDTRGKALELKHI